MDALRYRWHHHRHQLVQPTKANLSMLSMYRHSSHETSEPGNFFVGAHPKPSATAAAAASPVVSSSILRHGECGSLFPLVLPSPAAGGPGNDRGVPVLGEEPELVVSSDGRFGWSSSSNSQRHVRNGCAFGPWKVHTEAAHEQDFYAVAHQGGGAPAPNGLATDRFVLPVNASPPALPFQDYVGPAALSSSSSSSIGMGGEHSLSTSENGSEDDNNGDGEVQSAADRGLLNLSSLHDSLPIKRGLSRYFAGHLKSFGCLADSLSTGGLTKPANPYASRRRKNLSMYDDRHRSFPPLSQKQASGITKKSSLGSKSHLALAVAMEAAQEEE